MIKLLKLSNIAINVSHNDKYIIHMIDFDVGGFILFGSGGLDTYKTVVEINKTNKVSEYILRHSI